MTKQELATKIWGSTNQLRGNIELGTYKDYMLSLLFYKFLSDKEVKYLLDQGWTEEDMKSIDENDTDSVSDCQRNIGYFIAYENLFSTWIRNEHDFTVTNVTEALSAFDRLIGESHKKVFSHIFETLQSNISNLGTTAQEQTKALKKLIEVINEIPADKSQGYDVLGFIYEFLIGNFAANAGKKAGEFYTPHEVSTLMAEIVSHYLQDRDNVKILDPTSGSGSLLITIGKAFAKYSGKQDNVEYFAQEFIKSTYNLTRMNLIMKGILPNNIHVRNGDTLASDWPFFDDTDPESSYDPMYVDAVVSNPPYSQKWDPSNRESDPRFASYGIAPKGKADFAFLLYDLYHVKPDGIATVVLPHGVLFRGNEEKTIRQNLVENNKIDAIIGLPANLFYGTGIPTILLVLKQNRSNTDILIIDASKGFKKNGKKNQLQSSDIKRISDTYIARKEIAGYSRKVPKSEVVENDYNLNIPRYVDSMGTGETWDLYSLMLGGTPNYELDELEDYWNAFPSLRSDLFEAINPEYSRLRVDDIKAAVMANSDVQTYISHFNEVFGNFDQYLRERLLADPENVPVRTEEDTITDEIFNRYNGIALADPYKAYQILDDLYGTISTDLELIQAEGFSPAVQAIDPNMVTKKKDNGTIEEQDGWKGHVLPFELVQQLYLPNDLAELEQLNNKLSSITGEEEEILGSLSQEELDSPITNDDGTAFVAKEVSDKVKDILGDVTSPEIEALQNYLKLLDNKAKKNAKADFISSNTFVYWNNMTAAGDGTYARNSVAKYISQLQQEYVFEEDSFEAKMLHVSDLMQQEKDVKKSIKDKAAELEKKTIDYIQHIPNEEATEVLDRKWISPLTSQINDSPSMLLKDFIKLAEALSKKYATTMMDVESDIHSAETSLINMMNELTGSEFDLQGIDKFKSILGEDK